MAMAALPEDLAHAFNLMAQAEGWAPFARALQNHLEETERQRQALQEQNNNRANDLAQIEVQLQAANLRIQNQAARRPASLQGGAGPLPPGPANDRLSKIVKDPGEFDGTRGKKFEE